MARKVKKKMVKRDRRTEAKRFDVAVGERIRIERKAWPLKQSELGEQIGFSEAQISRYESGEATCEPHTLALIAKVMKCKASDFIDGIEV